ncbi:MULTISPECIES: M81 family metallopeptidase [unclassified Bradyrhizobium]|uniref:M81 family metallopeptidase n=1 Tax=unclassified Bradyrhizobium TaxID=2631580 RepID=UPI0024785BE1|nr:MULTISPECIES: M81 family metallopeptidase [unclassified Bradyrhizobium]WGS18891.1 M81 family metallopeptidase [Bradyrhizobium sp. ISRA463]WGS25720.1 M81 family metallopeptidase [Bradyrhizobium sp. ISRA464]
MSDRKIRIAVLQFSHETVSFLPNETTRDDFICPGSPAKGEALLRSDPTNYMGGSRSSIPTAIRAFPCDGEERYHD